MNIDINKICVMLDLTSDQAAATEKLTIIAENGVALLRAKNPLLTEEDFCQPGLARTLLQSYCRYGFSNAEELFKENYAEELLTLRLQYEGGDSA
jgi:hypothetical protein